MEREIESIALDDNSVWTVGSGCTKIERFQKTGDLPTSEWFLVYVNDQAMYEVNGRYVRYAKLKG